MLTLDTSPLSMWQETEIERAFISAITPTITSLVDAIIGFLNSIFRSDLIVEFANKINNIKISLLIKSENHITSENKKGN